ncbi:FUSC family protein (plasmid) [Cupriavidus sp. KK10]|jgi:hypothetical protein|uniref:FUSC family protein n=1 Tax=Cupriavidus sp. KK10 TaxID=1478019 RepID=UPI001BA92D12|nr:FUSC family protein [Cupriavidus sp. KK10]QUN32594.1 FUSC family protein [Cupriavidus sp. KK10]
MNWATTHGGEPLRMLTRGRHHFPLAEALRGGIVCATPAVLAAMLHEPLLCWSAIAAFWTCLSDESGAPVSRRMLYGMLFGAFGALMSFCAIASAWTSWLAIALTGVVAYAGALARIQGAAPGLRGLLVATSWCVCASMPIHGLPTGLHYAAFFMGGSAWAVACSVGLWQYSPSTRARRAVFAYLYAAGSYVHRLADAVSSDDVPAVHGRAELRAKLDALTRITGKATSGIDASCRRWRENGERSIALLAGLESLLSDPASPVRSASAKRLSAPLRTLATRIDLCADAVRCASNPDACGALDGPLGEIRAAMAHAGSADVTETECAWLQGCMTLVDQLAELTGAEAAEAAVAPGSLQRSSVESTRSTRRRIKTAILDHVRSNSEVARYALRLSVAAMIAVTVARVSKVDQGYWLALTTMFVVQPTVSQTLKVSGLRICGTILGAMLASVLALLVHNPILLALAIVPLAMGTLGARAMSYVSYILFLTPHFILVAYLGTPAGPPWALAFSRVGNSVAGAMVGVVVSLIAWPEWERHKLGAVAARAISAVMTYINMISIGDEFGPEKDLCTVAAVRRDACLAIDELEGVVNAMRLEPLSSSHRISHASVLTAHLGGLVGVMSTLECVPDTLGDGDDARLSGLAGRCTTLMRGQRRVDAHASLATMPDTSPHQSFLLQHVEQQAMEHAFVIGMVRWNVA